MLINTAYIASLDPCEDRFANWKSEYQDWSGSLCDFLSLDKITYNDKIWVAQRSITKNQAVQWAIKCAESVMHYSDDKRVHDCIATIKNLGPDYDNLSDAAASEARAASDAAWAAWAAARAASDAAWAAWAAWAASEARAASDASDAAWAARAARAASEARAARAAWAASEARAARAASEARAAQENKNIEFLKESIQCYN